MKDQLEGWKRVAMDLSLSNHFLKVKVKELEAALKLYKEIVQKLDTQESYSCGKRKNLGRKLQGVE